MIFISGFVETTPPIPGGLWSWDGARLLAIYGGGGVFGLTWWRQGSILLAATRDDSRPLLAFRRNGSELAPLDVRCEGFIPGRRVHGIAAGTDKLYVVASQGDPDSPISSNTDRWRDHRVGKVLISEVSIEGEGILVRNTVIWNPFQCDHHHHYNDALVDADFIYLAAFSTCDRSRILIDRGSVARFRNDLVLDRVISDGLSGPHSLQILDGRMYACSSETSSIVSIAIDGSDRTPRLEYKGINNFVRGLVVTDEFLFIGLSESAGRTESDRFTEPINGFLQFSRTTGEARRVALPAACQNVYAIVALPPDRSPKTRSG